MRKLLLSFVVFTSFTAPAAAERIRARLIRVALTRKASLGVTAKPDHQIELAHLPKVGGEYGTFAARIGDQGNWRKPPNGEQKPGDEIYIRRNSGNELDVIFDDHIGFGVSAIDQPKIPFYAVEFLKGPHADALARSVLLPLIDVSTLDSQPGPKYNRLYSDAASVYDVHSWKGGATMIVMNIPRLFQLRLPNGDRFDVAAFRNEELDLAQPLAP